MTVLKPRSHLVLVMDVTAQAQSVPKGIAKLESLRYV